MSAVAEFARPGRAGSIDRLVEALTDKAGFAMNPDGTLDAERLACLVEEQARVMAGAQIAAALHQSPVGASRRVDAALEIVDELPETLSALRDGLIDVPRARVIAERTQNLSPEARRAVQCAVLPLAQSRTPGQLIPMIDRRVIAKDPAAAWKRCERARRDRFVEHTPGVDGMGTIRAHLPAEGAVSVFDLLDAMARATAGMDGRPIGARRADALVDMCVELLTTGRLDLGDILNKISGSSGQHSASPAGMEVPDAAAAPTDPTGLNVDGAPFDRDGDAGPVERVSDGDSAFVSTSPGRLDPGAPSAGVGSAKPSGGIAGSAVPARKTPRVGKRNGRGAHFNLTMSVEAFLGLSDEPAELTGHGLVPAGLARLLRKSALSLAVVTVDANGHAVGVGSTVYAPNQVITDQVITAAGTCRFPSCRVPAASCDLDHREPFDHEHPERGGRTDPAEMDPGCRKHHLLKTHTGWSAVRSPHDGLTMIWTSPTGHQYVDHPREFALPEDERSQVLEQGGTTSSGSGDREGGCSCLCGCGCGDQCRVLTVDTNPGPSQAELTRRLIEKQQQQERDAASQRERQRLNMKADPVWMYRLGPDTDAQRRIDAAAEQAAVEADQFDIDDYYRHYEAPTEAFMRRFCPAQYSIEQAAARQAARPDPDSPPY